MTSLLIPDDQLQDAVDAYATHGGERTAARALGWSRDQLKLRLEKARLKGIEPKCSRLIRGEEAGPGPGQALKGTSTLYGEDGKAKLQWVKTDKDTIELERLQRAALAAMVAEIEPIPLIAPPAYSFEDLLTLITITDSHVGMLAWDKETGEDWDLGIAEQCLTQTFCRMIDAAPASAIGIINQLGDFLHFDSLVPLTPTSKHVLDADSRYQKVVEVAVRILRRIIEHALTKFPTVQVYMHEGNHDPAGSVWLRVMFAQLFEKNKRVTIGMSPNPYTAYEFGVNFLGFHHGHLSKKDKLPLLFAAKFSEMWGRRLIASCTVGTYITSLSRSIAGISVMQHATLAAPDAYAARNG